MVISRLRSHHAVTYPIYSVRARAVSGAICYSHEELRSSFIFIIVVSVLGHGQDATRRRATASHPLNAPLSTRCTRAYKHLNIYETFIRARSERSARAIDSAFRIAFRNAFDFGRPVCVVRRYHRRRRQCRRRRFAPPRTTFFHLSATPVFAIARRTTHTGALFFRYFSFGRR